jgi:hypothetical protein
MAVGFANLAFVPELSTWVEVPGRPANTVTTPTPDQMKFVQVKYAPM